MNKLKPANDYLVDWRKKRTLPDINFMANSIVKNILEIVGEYNFNLKHEQINKIEPALNDILTQVYERKNANTEILSVAGFIIACGMINR